MIKNMKFLTTAVNQKQWPDTSKNEVILCGKSNVGKSSLINALANNSKLAYTGKTPGKTRTLNFYDSESYRLVDAPGYGFYKVKADDINNFEKILKEYFQNRRVCKGVLLLLNSQRDDISDEDMDMIDLASEFKIPTVIVLTKADKLSKTELQKKIQMTAKQLEIDPEDIYVTSSEKKMGLDRLISIIEVLTLHKH